MDYIKALGWSIGSLLLMLLAAPLRSAVYRTDLKKDIKYVCIIWAILSAIFFIALLVNDLKG